MHNSAVLYSADSALLTAAAALQLLQRRYSKEVVWRVSLLLLAAPGSPTPYSATAVAVGGGGGGGGGGSGGGYSYISSTL